MRNNLIAIFKLKATAEALVTTEGFMSEVRSCSAPAQQLSRWSTVAQTDSN